MLDSSEHKIIWLCLEVPAVDPEDLTCFRSRKIWRPSMRRFRLSSSKICRCFQN